MKTPLLLTSLLCHRHMDMAVRCLGSLQEACSEKLDFLFFEDGSLTAEDAAVLRETFPGSRLITRKEADDLLAPELARRPNCRRHREKNVMLLKIVDVPLLSGRSYLYCDSDILFFGRFKLDALLPELDRSFTFMRDAREGYSAGLRKFLFTHHLKMLSRVNAGLMSVPMSRFDLDFVEWFMGVDEFFVFKDVVEQSCWAAMPKGEGAYYYDPAQAFCSTRKLEITERSVAIHFCGAEKSKLPNLYSQAAELRRSSAVSLELVTADRLGVKDVLYTGVRNRLLPPHLR